MDLRTIYSLNYNDGINGETTIYSGDLIKLFLCSKEVLLGEYNYSDYDDLTLDLDTNGNEIYIHSRKIDFEDISHIEIIKRKTE